MPISQCLKRDAGIERERYTNIIPDDQLMSEVFTPQATTILSDGNSVYCFHRFGGLIDEFKLVLVKRQHSVEETKHVIIS